ncbi:MAG: tRNA (adenosine(37)-N6)-dimethylallyltransferase MiaA, partial [Syntrophobacteraceae bacterium]|nr:tRNA (adenosine(37)-N6)-dimethylallyltransferase MiaA [Syntrophobacteraceae bacterium]
MPRLPIILLGGPTGVGKTAFALELARRLGTEIINADSMQVYRFMDIGTAKPTREERLAVTHHLLDVVNPDEPFDASLYADMAHPLVAALHQRGKIALVVGGTGLYMKTLTRGICPGAPSSGAERLRLLHRL